MADVNTVVIVGRLTRDLNPSDQREFAYTPNGQARANISVAVGSRKKNGDQWIDEANYFDVTIWGKSAENLKQYLTKGKQIAVEGSLRQERWQDKETGKTRSRVYIVANNVHLLGGSNAQAGQGYQPNVGAAPTYQQNQNFQNQGQQGGYVPNNAPTQQYQPIQQSDFGGGMENFPDDVPF